MITTNSPSPRAHASRAVLGAFVALASAALLQAQDTYPSTPPSSTSEKTDKPGPDNGYSKLPRADSSFLVKAARANSEEFAISRIATTRATNPEVRAFAQELVTAHESVDNGILRLATAKTVTLSPMTADDMTKKWSDKKAAEFDEDYVKEMISAHKKALSLFQDASRDGKDNDVSTFAREQLATLTEHLRKAEELQKNLK